MLDQVFALYKKALLAHIATKGTASQFHEKSAEFYEAIFDVFHAVSEKRQDLGLSEPMDCEEAGKEAYDALSETLSIVEDLIKEKNSVGMDNLLRGLADKLEGHIGDACAFLEEEAEEENEPEEVETPEEKPKMKSFRKA